MPACPSIFPPPIFNTSLIVLLLPLASVFHHRMHDMLLAFLLFTFICYLTMVSSMRDIAATHKPDCHLPFCESKTCPLVTVSVKLKVRISIRRLLLPNKNLIQRRLIVFYSMALLRFGSKFLFVSVLLSLWFDLVFLFFFFNYLFCVFPLPDGGFTDSREHKSSANIPIS